MARMGSSYAREQKTKTKKPIGTGLSKQRTKWKFQMRGTMRVPK